MRVPHSERAGGDEDHVGGWRRRRGRQCGRLPFDQGRQFLEKSAAYQRAVSAEHEQGRMREEAEEAREAAEVEAPGARRRAYAADMNLVQQALAANNLGRAQELLNRHRVKS